MQTGVDGVGGREASQHKQQAIGAFQVYSRCSSRRLRTGVSWLTLAERGGAQAAGGRVNAGGDLSKTTSSTKEWTAATKAQAQRGGRCAVRRWLCLGVAAGERVGGGGGERGVVVVVVVSDRRTQRRMDLAVGRSD